MSSDANPRLESFVERLVASWNAHDLDRLVAMYDVGFEGEDVGVPRPIRGHDGVRAWAAPYWEAFPDLAFDVTETVAENDRVVLVWVARGTHRGPLMGIPPTGRGVRFQGVSVLTVRSDRVTRGLYMWNVADLLKALGLTSRA